MLEDLLNSKKTVRKVLQDITHRASQSVRPLIKPALFLFAPEILKDTHTVCHVFMTAQCIFMLYPKT